MVLRGPQPIRPSTEDNAHATSMSVIASLHWHSAPSYSTPAASKGPGERRGDPTTPQHEALEHQPCLPPSLHPALTLAPGCVQPKAVTSSDITGPWGSFSCHSGGMLGMHVGVHTPQEDPALHSIHRGQPCLPCSRFMVRPQPSPSLHQPCDLLCWSWH